MYKGKACKRSPTKPAPFQSKIKQQKINENNNSYQQPTGSWNTTKRWEEVHALVGLIL
jgi:hypothetical protein